jgi:hypothetical protein
MRFFRRRKHAYYLQQRTLGRKLGKSNRQIRRDTNRAWRSSGPSTNLWVPVLALVVVVVGIYLISEGVS